jgi:hypothetical protein
MSTEPTDVYLKKMRMVEDLAARLQKEDYKTRGNRDKLDCLLKEGLDYIRAHDVTMRLKRRDALEKALGLLDRLRSIHGSEADRVFDTVLICARVARTGKGSV